MPLLHRNGTEDRVDVDTDRPAWPDPEVAATYPAATTTATSTHERVIADPVVVDPDQRVERVVVRRNSAGQTIRTILGTVFLVAVVGFAALNTGRADFDLGFESYDLQMSAVIGAVAAAGFIAGCLFTFRSRSEVVGDRNLR